MQHLSAQQHQCLPNCCPWETSPNICIAPTDIAAFNASAPHLLGTLPHECLETARSFFNSLIARVPWEWAQVPRGEVPRPGYMFLPFVTAPTVCLLRLAVLDDPDAEDQFAIVQLADDFRALFDKYVRGRVHGVAAGYVPVGPRKVVKLYIGPTPDEVGATEDTLER